MKVDVVVVGGGISGLTAAYQLHKKDSSLQIIVLEAKDRVGGRTLTLPLKAADGTDNFDLGGQWVGRCQPHIMALLEELGLTTHVQYLEGKKFMQLGSDRISSYSSDIPSLSPLALIDLQRFMYKLEWMRKQVDIGDPYQSQYGAEWDAMTLETFFNKQLWTKGAKETIESASRCMFGIESSQISVLYYISYLSGAGSLKNLIEATEYTAQEYRIIGGAQQISQKLAASLPPSCVQLQQPVRKITQQENGDVTVTTEKGDVYSCDRLILAIPPNMTNKIQFDPLLPSCKRELVKRMPAGNLIKVIVTYKEAFWRKAGLSGEFVTNGGPSVLTECDRGPLCIVYDATSARGNAAIVAFLGGAPAIQWRNQKKEDRRSAVLKSLSDFLGPEALNYLDYVEKDWSVEPYNEGCPVCTVGPGAMAYFAAGLRLPFNRIHFAGTESATVWCGFMNGAVQSGLRAANEILFHLRPQAVSAQELATTAYGPSSFLPHTKSKGSRSRTFVKVTLGLGAVVAIVIIAKKVASSLNEKFTKSVSRVVIL
ncbi:probable flavin-containing monoamine oxidase A [Saccostrea cucullata]|uniref:probable flavin-containing monoamine oxidase A n=1 Tax=Saccostrea cuccullata TaxID=36930 RepID=UPI002ED2430F